MPDTPSVFVGGGIVAVSCGKAVRSMLVSGRKDGTVSTGWQTLPKAQWESHRVLPMWLHKFGVQFCAPKVLRITDRRREFSPLSTPLIIRSMWVKEENSLIGKGG